LFLQYLRGHDEDNKEKTFKYNNDNVKLCQYIGTKIYNQVKGEEPPINSDGHTKFLYDILIDGKVYAPNEKAPEKSQWYYQGLYPSFVMATMVEAEEI
jgi:hypothetical protein